MKNLLSKALIAFAALLSGNSYGQSTPNHGAACGCPALATRPTVNLSTLADNLGNFTQKNTVLTCDKTYIIDNNNINTTGKYYVGKGKSITIAPGTVIKGMPETTLGTSRNGGILVISRGGKIFASGTETCPIVFTTTLDVNVNGSYGITNKGKWGGIVVLGTATNNLLAGNASGLGVSGLLPGTGRIEGFTSPEPRIYFGANSADPDPDFQTFDDNDNSGIMSYVSIRHGGEVIGANNEINGLTLGSVGRGTTLHHIEVVSNLDDGIEFFGGTVDLKYASVLFSDDDNFDWDLNWSGRGQFWVSIKTDQGTAPGGDNGFESDGDDQKLGVGPFSNPNVYNATYIGSLGINGNTTIKGMAIELKEQTNGTIRNSVFANYGTGARFVDDATRPGGLDAYDNWQAGTLKVECNTFVGVTNPAVQRVGTTDTPFASGSADHTKFFTTDKNVAVATLASFDFIHEMNVNTNAMIGNNLVDLVPSGGVLTTGCPVAPVDGFFTPALYRGAFEPNKKSWLSTYTYNTIIGIEKGLLPCPTDSTGDGITNSNDLNALLGVFGQGCN
jgi:hypothetical protein